MFHPPTPPDQCCFFASNPWDGARHHSAYPNAFKNNNNFDFGGEGEGRGEPMVCVVVLIMFLYVQGMGIMTNWVKKIFKAFFQL